MKRLLILRHAQSLGTETGGTDKTRKLSPNGIKDAQVLGALMAREGLQPDAVLCSAATRTRQTLEGVMESLEDTKIEYLDRLYNADFDVADDGSAAAERLLMSYAPATLTVLDCDIDDWTAIKPYANRVTAVHETTEYNADDRPTRWM